MSDTHRRPKPGPPAPPAKSLGSSNQKRRAAKPVASRRQPSPAAPAPRSEEELDDCLTTPQPALVEFIRTLSGPLVIVGAGGKMGPTLAVLARRAARLAAHPLEVIAVSRFTDSQVPAWLKAHDVAVVSADILDRTAVQRLPDAGQVLYLVGLKFGTRENPHLTWAVNTLGPAHVAERYPRARWVALSTGNVYPLQSIRESGAREDHPLTPMGEYANAAVARERLLDYFARRNGTPIAILRLNYAVELRYGVLADIASKVWRGEPIQLDNGSFNCIWQGDANDRVIRSLALAGSPAVPWNLTGPIVRVREVALRLGECLARRPIFEGQELETALLSNPAKLCALFGDPPTPIDTMIRWTALWVSTGGRSLQKPTHFDVRNGAF